MAETSEPQPLLVIKGAGREGIERARTIGCVVVGLIVAGTVLGGSYAFPALSVARMRTTSFRLLMLVGVAGAYVAERFVRAKSGRVELYASEIVFLKDRAQMSGAVFFFPSNKIVLHEVHVPWTDVTGFRDDKAEYVKVLTKAGASSFHTIPTLREEDRVAVLKLLDEKGVPRVE